MRGSLTQRGQTTSSRWRRHGSRRPASRSAKGTARRTRSARFAACGVCRTCNLMLSMFSLADKCLHQASHECRCRNVRTSQGTFISRHEDQDGVLAWVEDKIALLSGIPAGHGEVCYQR